MLIKMFLKKGEYILLFNYFHVIFFIICTLVLTEIVGTEQNNISLEHIKQQCIEKCPVQNRTNYEHSSSLDCGNNCYNQQCILGCNIWETALDSSSCQEVCNKTDQERLETKELYCVRGCSEALNGYFKWLKAEVGSMTAPALIAGTLNSTSLSLEWDIPKRFTEITKQNVYHKSYLVQWRFEELAGDWKLCRNQSMGENSTVKVENLHPYTKYRFRVALRLSQNTDEVIVSEQSVIISTTSAGVPLSKPAIVRAVAVDHTRISVSWEPGPFPNGPILSYVLQIKELTQNGYSALKEVPTNSPSHFYLFENLTPEKRYQISVTIRNQVGEGPAAEEIVTTLKPPISDGKEIEAILILCSEYGLYTTGSIKLKSPQLLYASLNKMIGFSIHVAKNFMFYSDDAGFINKINLNNINEVTTILTPDQGLNFKPSLLSVDWLNNQLYILGKIDVPDVDRWQISRCSLDGKGLTIAIAGLNTLPNHIEVDPYNGYLFWVITGQTDESGLYRLDLGDISNGVKHDVTQPQQILKHHDLGAFTVDYVNFKLLVPFQRINTVMSITFDGSIMTNIRHNTSKPRFGKVISIAMVNDLFYFTNGGTYFIAEAFYQGDKKYYHNILGNANARPIKSVCVMRKSAQPIPIPVNPPSKLQALLSGRNGKISWLVPHSLKLQGKGAYQEWLYELQTTNENTKTVMNKTIKSTSVIIDNLQVNTNYTFRVAAFTDGSISKGPWCTEFHAKTLKSNHERYLIWSTDDGLMESDIVGENIKTLVTKNQLADQFVTDITWFDDIIYFVSNSTLKFFNKTNQMLTTLDGPESAESIAVDWIGKKLYWSNPTKSMITRGNLYGGAQEPLPVLGVREMKIDSLRGDLYFSTASHTVETCRLNANERKKYTTNENKFPENHVIGLTLDLDNERIYWIVRNFEGFIMSSAPLSNKWKPGQKIKTVELQEGPPYGPLTHFSDRLMWLHDNYTLTIGDVNGNNLAKITNSKLRGLRAVSVIDPTHYTLPKMNGEEINVIPEQILNNSIRISSGTWKTFKIVWDSVKTVNYGQVFYDVEVFSNKIKCGSSNNLIIPEFSFLNSSLPPYSLIEVTVKAFTFWGNSVYSTATLFSPTALPTEPVNPRVFISHETYPIYDDVNIKAYFRWDEPKQTNGKISEYIISCYYVGFNGEKHYPNCNGSSLEREKIITNIIYNVTYFFQVQAVTSAGIGNKSKILSINTKDENPIPSVLVASDNIFKIDLDLNEISPFLGTGSPVVFIDYISSEKRFLYITENNELISYRNNTKNKLASFNTAALSLTVDWIERIIYWSQLNGNGSTINSLNLNKFENGQEMVEEIFKTKNLVKSLRIIPQTNRLYWIDSEKSSKIGNLIYLDIGSDQIQTTSNCFNITEYNSPLILDTSISDDFRLLFSSSETGFISKKIKNKECKQLGLAYNSAMSSFVKDSGRLYWITENEINSLNDNDQSSYNFEMNATKPKQLLAFYNQEYPHKKCLKVPKHFENNKIPTIINISSNYMEFKMPGMKIRPGCNLKPPGIKYTIRYRIYKEKTSEFNYIFKNSFDEIIKVDGLIPFTTYQFSIGFTNYYEEQMGHRTEYGPEIINKTAPGVPSPIENINAEPISPTEAIVQWLPPSEFNADSVWYEVHWHSDKAVNGVTNRQHRKCTTFLIDDETDYLEIKLTDLLPNQSYKVWIRSYSNNFGNSSDLYSSSQTVKIEMLPEPEELQITNITSTSLQVQWKYQKNIARYILQYTRPDLSFDDSKIVYDSLNVTIKENFDIIDLQPKTNYKFSLQVYYPKRKDPYQWPQDPPLKETLADRPGAPGKPQFQTINKGIFGILWESSKDNGAKIEFYILEGIKSDKTIKKRAPRSTTQNEPQIINSSVLLLNQQTVEELEPIEDEWQQLYSGNSTFFYDSSVVQYRGFKVRAKNIYGWSPYSEPSFRINDSYITAQNNETLVIAVAVPIFAVLIVVLAAILIYAGFRRRRIAALKKIKETSLSRLPDVELANLRNLPRRSNFIQSSNILYNTGPLTDSDIASLPQIKREQLSINKLLGTGAFAEVYEGIVRNVDESDIKVAIKTLRKGATDQEKGEFLQEAQLMSNFKYEHILPLIGVCLSEDSLYIIMELMQGGALLSFLRQSRPTVESPSSLRLFDLISMCVDVASGCRYLEEMHYVHRDLACRNCLVSSFDSTKRKIVIGDFGLARDIYKNDYYRKEGEGLLPVRWMSPESLVDGVFTSQSDIWAFGVLCWEIMTLGEQPYPARDNNQVYRYVREGGTLERPTDCSDELYQLMLKCWSYSPDDRPTFLYCLEVLKLLQLHTSDSIQITMQFPSWAPNGGVFNQSYMLGMQNNQIGTLRFSREINLKIAEIEEPIKISTGPTSTPQYLELIYDENETENQTQHFTDGYEIPIKNNELNLNNNNLGSNKNQILTVVLPPNCVKDDCSSMEALLPLQSKDSICVNGMSLIDEGKTVM